MGYARSQDNRKMAGENIVYSKGNGVERKCVLLVWTETVLGIESLISGTCRLGGTHAKIVFVQLFSIETNAVGCLGTAYLNGCSVVILLWSKMVKSYKRPAGRIPLHKPSAKRDRRSNAFAGPSAEYLVLHLSTHDCPAEQKGDLERSPPSCGEKCQWEAWRSSLQSPK